MQTSPVRRSSCITTMMALGLSLTALCGHGGTPLQRSTDKLDRAPLLDTPAPNPPWHYRLLAGSTLTEDCPLCDRPVIPLPMRGSFELRLLEGNGLFSTYAVEALAFEAGGPSGFDYKVRGRGIYRVGGEVAWVQDVFLEVWIDNGVSNTLCYLTNATRQVTRGWPLLQAALDQTNGTPIQQYQFELRAAPVREIWFSTAHALTPGVQPPPAERVSAGDLISATGRVVKRNRELTRELGLMPGVPDLGLDAVDILPGGEVAFSIEQDAFSETLGPLHHGDLLSHTGRVVRAYLDLIGPFSPMPPVVDPGLDAVQVLDSGEVYFSVETGFFSQRLGVYVQRGDLLSSAGRVFKTREELLARFHPPPIPMDFGLDAVFVWPSGEVWFSLEEGFTDAVLGDIRPGDLLSDQGELLYRNRELVAAFQPLEEMVDFGLDALFIVSDAVTAAPGTPALRCAVSSVAPATGDVTLRWEGAGRLYQVEKATKVLGPWLPLSPVLLEPPAVDLGALTNAPQAFYRVRQW